MSKKHLYTAVLVLLTGLTATSCKKLKEPTGDIEKQYAAAGGHSVNAIEIKDDAGNKMYKVHYPSPLPGPCPVVVWGNGTGGTPENYEGVMSHLAGWGFIVIGSYDGYVGTGQAILTTVDFMNILNTDTSGIFYAKADMARVGAVGHSQGAAGILNAHTDFPAGSIFKTLVPVNLPTPKWTAPEHVYNPELVQVPVFLMSGKADGLISPVKSNGETFDALPQGLPAVMGLAAGAGHLAFTKSGGRHVGYLTAWLRYQLFSDTVAAGAFTGADAEIKNNSGWKDVHTKNLN